MADPRADGASGRGGRRPGAGRPRSRAADAAILTATTDMLREVGVRALSVEAVADRAGVSVGSVYRRWPSKSSLVAAAYRDVIGPAEPVDTGSLEGDLVAVSEDTFRFFTGDHARLLAALHTESGGDPELTTAIHTAAEPRRRTLRFIVRRAIERGEIAADTDVELAIDVFVGPLWTRLLVTGRRITRGTVLRAARLAAAALRP